MGNSDHVTVYTYAESHGSPKGWERFISAKVSIYWPRRMAGTTRALRSLAPWEGRGVGHLS